MIQGYRHGFVFTIIRTGGWLLSLVVSFVLFPKFYDYLSTNTELKSRIHSTIYEKISTEGEAIFLATENLPSILKETALSAASGLFGSLADTLSDMILRVLSFVILIILIKLLLFIITFLFSKKKRRGPVSFFDGVFGLIAGAAKGIFVVLIILILFVPLTMLGQGELQLFISNALEGSIFAGGLYQHNPLLAIVEAFFD